MFSFTPAMRLHKSSDYKKLFDLGVKYHSKHLIVFTMQKNNGPTRLGLTVSRKVGGAVTRNRLKRQLREIFRLSLSYSLENTDIMILAKKNASILDYHQLNQELLVVCSRMKNCNVS
jgi:ribonuclease P protein component